MWHQQIYLRKVPNGWNPLKLELRARARTHAHIYTCGKYSSNKLKTLFSICMLSFCRVKFSVSVCWTLMHMDHWKVWRNTEWLETDHYIQLVSVMAISSHMLYFALKLVYFPIMWNLEIVAITGIRCWSALKIEHKGVITEKLHRSSFLLWFGCLCHYYTLRRNFFIAQHQSVIKALSVSCDFPANSFNSLSCLESIAMSHIVASQWVNRGLN